MSNPFNIFDFVSDQEIKLPEGGAFAPRGMVAPWQMGVYHTIMIEGEMPLPENLKPTFVVPVSRKEDNKWFTLYFEDKVKAALAGKEFQKLSPKDRGYNPNMRYHFEAATSDVVNAANPSKLIESFGEILTHDVDVYTYGSAKRYTLHMFLLPSAVAAVAKRYGYDTPGFDVSELAGRSDEFVLSDEVQARYIGHPDTKDIKDPTHWKNSIMWQRRAALWAALDEPNPEVYESIGAGGKFETKSEKLNNCLGLLSRAWSKALWVRMAWINNPDMKSKYNDKPGRVSVLTEFFDSKEVALAATAAEREGKSEDAEAPVVVTGGNGSKPAASPVAKPPYPEAWIEAQSEFEGLLATALSEGKAPPAVAKDLGGVSVPEVIAWKKYLGL